MSRDLLSQLADYGDYCEQRQRAVAVDDIDPIQMRDPWVSSAGSVETAVDSARSKICKTCGSDLTVRDLGVTVESPELKPRKRRAAVLALAAAILVLAWVVVVADRNDSNVEIELVSSAAPEESGPPSEQSAVFGDGVEVRQELNSVIAAGPGVVAVGYSSTGSFTFPVYRYDDAAVWTSVDGMMWSRVPHDPAVFSPIQLQIMTDVTVGGPGLVAVGHMVRGNGFAFEGLGALVWTSVDGMTWSLVPHDEAIFDGPGNQYLTGVAAGGPGLVAVGVDGGGYGRSVDAAVWTSIDGFTWSRVPHDETIFGGAEIHSVTVGGPGLVAVGSSGVGGNNLDISKATEADKNFATDSVVWTSTDGITWSRVPHDSVVFGGRGDQSMSKVIAAGPGLVAVGVDSDGNDDSVDAAVWTSVDGFTWSRVPHDETIFGGAEIHSVTAGGPGLVAVGLDAAICEGDTPDCEDVDAAVWTSADGITWARVATSEEVFGGAGSQSMSGVATTNGTLVAVGRDGTGAWGKAGTVQAAVWTSTDGITWSRAVPGEDG